MIALASIVTMASLTVSVTVSFSPSTETARITKKAGAATATRPCTHLQARYRISAESLRTVAQSPRKCSRIECPLRSSGAGASFRKKSGTYEIINAAKHAKNSAA